MATELWQQKTLEEIKKLFSNYNSVHGLAISGSLNTDIVDIWSDIDLIVVVEDDKIPEFANDLGWLKPLGTIFAYQNKGDEYSTTIRVVFEDFKRTDFVFTTVSALKAIVQSPRSNLWQNIKVIYSDSEVIKTLLDSEYIPEKPKEFSKKQFQDLVNNFWFISSLSLSKVIRKDLLVALHLALDLYKECLLLAILIRDKETGTTLHKTGGMGNDLAKSIHIPLKDTSQEAILDLLKQCGQEFQKLCVKWNPKCPDQFATFELLIRKARKDI